MSLFYKPILVALLMMFSVFANSVLADESKMNAVQFLSDYLVSEGFNDLVIGAVGNKVSEEEGFRRYLSVDCTYSINRCRVVGEDIEGRKLSAWFRVYSQQYGWKTRKLIRKHERINALDLEWVMTDSFVCGNKLVSKDSLNSEAMTSGRVKKGTTLCVSHLQKIEGVAAGDTVSLTSTTEMLQLLIEVKVLDSGNVGDTIRVRIPSSGNILQAKVVSSELVESEIE